MVDGMAMNVDTRKLEQIIRDLPGSIDDFLGGVAVSMVGDMQTRMDDSPADGITYRRGNITHVASSPGNAPRPDTGELKASLNNAPRGKHEQIIADGVEHGRHQELGTEFIEPRPFMVPTFEEWRRGKFAEAVDAYPLVE
ncbi:MAG: hypothetical protein AAFN11_09855 [Chloroflexota bacterium]